MGICTAACTNGWDAYYLICFGRQKSARNLWWVYSQACDPGLNPTYLLLELGGSSVLNDGVRSYSTRPETRAEPAIQFTPEIGPHASNQI